MLCYIYILCIPCPTFNSFPLAGGTATARGVFPPGSDDTPIALANVVCVGTENHLADCVHDRLPNIYCFHFEDAGVECNPGGLTHEVIVSQYY